MATPASKNRPRKMKLQPIRRVQDGDLKPVLALAKKTGVFTAKEIAVVKELVEAGLKNLTRDGYHSLVFEENDQLLGFACYGPTPMTEGTYDLYWLFVDPEEQRRGIGGALVGAVEKAIYRAKGRMLIADTSSTTSYLPARRFYQNHGFRKVAEVRDYYCPGDSRFTYVKQFS